MLEAERADQVGGIRVKQFDDCIRASDSNEAGLIRYGGNSAVCGGKPSHQTVRPHPDPAENVTGDNDARCGHARGRGKGNGREW